MFRLAFKSVKHSPKRLLLTAAAVALGVSLVAATFTFTNALSSGFRGLFEDIYGTTDVFVQAAPGDVEEDPWDEPTGEFTEAELDAVAAVDGVETVRGNIPVDVSVIPADFNVEELADAPPGGGGPPTQISNWIDVPELALSTVTEGRAPEAAGEIVLDEDSAPSLGYDIGDSVPLTGDFGKRDFTLVGIISFGDDNATQGATVGYLTNEDAWALNGTDTYGSLRVDAAESADVESVQADIDDMFGDDVRVVTGEELVKESSEQLDEALTYVDIFAIAFALISLFVGAYIIVNTFRIIVTQRTREFGLMRAIGVTGKQVRTMILLEAVVVAIAASTLGIIAGYLLALGASELVSATFDDVFGTVTLPIDAVLWSYVLGIVVTLIAAITPAIHASRIAPMEALRESATAGKKPLKTRNIVGGAVAILGAMVVTLGLYAGLERPYIYVGVGAVMLVLGSTLLAAQVLVPMAFGLRSLLTRLFRVDGKLAANNIRREPRRSANTAAALMIGVMLLALVATFTESLKTTVTAEFDRTEADYFVIGGPEGIPQGAIDTLRSLDGVESVANIGLNQARYDDRTYMVGTIEPELADDAYDYDVEPAFSKMNGGVYIDPAIQDLGVEVGDEVTLEGPEATLALEVTGSTSRSGDANFWVDDTTGAELFGEVTVFQSMVMLEDGLDASDEQLRLQTELAEEYPLVVLTQPDVLQQTINMFIDMLLGVISALLASALVIAILGVANTLLLSVTERTREIGLLRAVGLKRRSVWRMITIESMVMAIFGTILGMILGVGLGSALVLALSDFGFNGVTVPWIWMGVYTVLAALAGVAAAVWPAWRASRLDILKAIAADG